MPVELKEDILCPLQSPLHLRRNCSATGYLLPSFSFANTKYTSSKEMRDPVTYAPRLPEVFSFASQPDGDFHGRDKQIDINRLSAFTHYARGCSGG